jgi:hypothetical protein
LFPRWIQAAFIAALCCVFAHAQNVSGKFVGTITDASGAAVAAAIVTATQVETSAERQVESDSTGNYTLDLLPPGTYRITAEKPGFKRSQLANLELQVNQTARIDVRLEVGSVNESLNVTAQAAVVESETASVGQVITPRQVQNLPLNGRSFFNLVQLSPAVTPSEPGSGIVSLHPVPGSLSYPAFNVAGAREQGNGYLIDGVDAQDPHVEVPSIYVSVDAIQEFRLEMNGYSAEYGRHASQIIVATRGGTNQIHGSAYEFFRNDAMDATSFFTNATRQQKPLLRYNQFGGTLGGPIALPRNSADTHHTFYFINYEGTRINQGATAQLAVPTALQKTGNLSPVGSFGNKPIYDPSTTSTTANVTSRQLFPNNIIPTSRIAQFGVDILNLYPDPNLNVATGNNFAASLVNYSNNDQGMGRVDHNFGSHDSVFLRYSIYSGALSLKSPIHNGGYITDMTTQNVGLNYVHIFTPTTLNEIRLGYNRPRYYQLQDGAYGTNFSAQLGLKNLADVPAAYGNPVVSTTGYAGIAASDIYPSNQLSNIYQIVEQLSLTRGRHSLKIGADLRKINYNDETERQVRGNLSFTGGLTANPASPAGTGMSLADLLLGLPLTSNGSRTSLAGVFNGYNYGFYFQDDWKASPSLTINLGLRYDLNTRLVNKLNHITLFDRTFPGGRLLLAGTNQTYIPGIGYGTGPYTSPGLLPSNLNDWQPRIGIAWRPFNDNRTAVRAGYGIFFSQIELQDLRTWLRNPPFGDIASLQSDQNGNSNSPTVIKVTDLFPAAGSSLSQPSIYSAGDRGRDPYYQQWNINVQQSLGTTLFQVGYIGSKGTGLAQRINANQATLTPDPLHPTSIQSRTPYPLFGSLIRLTQDAGSSTYHALFAKVERRLSSDLSFLASYTYSKAIDEASLIDDNARNIYDLSLDRGRAAFDLRHNFALSGTYELPFGKSKRYLTGGVAGAIVGGWQFNTITTIRSGFPFTVNANGDACLCGASPQTAQQVGDAGSGFTQSRLEWFNTAAFAQPLAGTIGTSGRNILNGPKAVTVNLSLFRNFRFADRANLQFRVEAFNIFNHTNFGIPGSTVGTSTYGVISSADPSRNLQLAAKITF